MDTNANSSPARKPWALWAALALLAAGAIAVLYVLFAASSKPEQTAGLSRFARGDLARLVVLEAPPAQPTRALQDATGADTNLQAFAGEVVLVNLWATWCAPCMEEMPTLGALQRRMEGRLHVIPISVDSQAELGNAQERLGELTENTLPFYSDMTRGVLFDVQAPGMPVTILYDRQGREVARLSGGADWASDDAVALMEAAIAGE